MPTVHVRFSALPTHVRTARLVATAVARRSGVDESLLDEVRLAVGEACSRAVELHQRHAPQELVRVTLSDDQQRFSVEVSDVGPAGEEVPDISRLDPGSLGAAADAGRGPLSDPMPAGFGLAVIAGLVDEVEVTSGADGAGTSVRMTWPVTSPAATGSDASVFGPAGG